MPANTWSIQHLNAVEILNPGRPPIRTARTLASLGIDSATFDFNNLAADTVTFTAGGRDVDAAALWDYGTLIALLRPDGTRFFFGRVEPWTRDGRPDTQNHLGRLVNPWWYFEHKIYEQTYKSTQFKTIPAAGAPLPETVTNIYTTPRVILNILFDGNPGGQGFYNATTGQQIADAVNWAISQGAPVKLGVCEPSTLPFSAMQKGVACSDVIKLMFRKEPDFVMDWDYSTLPFPTVHFRKKFTPLTIDLRDATLREQVSLKERPDWQRSYVKINYDQSNQTIAGQYLSVYAEWYSALGQGIAINGNVTGVALPADTESRFRGVDLFCDLAGNAVSGTTQTASFASLPFDITSLETWTQWHPSLAASNVASASILTADTVPSATEKGFANPLIASVNESGVFNPANKYWVVDGEWADWIPGVTGQRVRITARARVVSKNGSVHYPHLTKELTAVSYNTGGVSKDFTGGQINITQYAEPVPLGLAQAMWTSWQNLAIEGSFTNVEAVIGARQEITRANSLNFLTTNPGAAGAPDWRKVNALVQQISGDIARGATRVSFGAPLKITGHELIDAVRATRYRTTTIDLAYLFGGAIGGGVSQVRFGRKTHAHHTDHGAVHKEVDAVSSADALDGTRTNVVTTNSPDGVIQIEQNDTATGDTLTTSTVMAELTGTGAPGPDTLA